jgi:hypothetical protein
MNKKVLTTIALAMMGYFTTGAQDTKAVLEAAAQALHAGKLTSIQFSGRGSQFELGQAAGPDMA